MEGNKGMGSVSARGLGLGGGKCFGEVGEVEGMWDGGVS